MATGDYNIADPFKFHFEIAWEVANKGEVSNKTTPLLKSV